MSVMTLSEHSFICKLKKKSMLHGLSIPNPNFSEFTFLVNRSADQELWISIFQAIDNLDSSKNPNFLFFIWVLRSWGWDLTMVGKQPKTPIVAYIVYGCRQYI